MARKKTTKKAPGADPTVREFTIVLEDLRGQFAVFGEALQGFREDVDRRFAQVDARFEQVDARFAQVDARFAQVDARFAQVDARFAQVDARFAQVDERGDSFERRFDRVEQDLGLVKVAVVEHSHDLREIRATVTRIEAALETKVDRAEVEAIVDRKLAQR